MRKTIFALATAPGRAAVAVVRVSGPDAGGALAALVGRMPPPRRAGLRTLRGADGTALDQALILWLPGPTSFTGEDCAELHLHGGPAVVASVLTGLADLGLSLAEPGEFTRRAFAAGKLDLAQAEAIADLVDAETALQAKQALDQLGGALSRRHEAWRERLVEALAHLEAAIDFPDEDLPADVAARAAEPIQALRAEIAAALLDAERGRRVRDGFRVALIGAPNAGKSTLFNALLKREAAIVTPTPGTTRDVLEAPLTLAGYRVLLADAAGLRESADAIEQEGVRRARAWASEADLRIWLVDAAGTEGDWAAARDLAQPGDLLLLNQIDRGLASDGEKAGLLAAEAGMDTLQLSLRNEGASSIVAWLEARVIAALSGAEFPAATRLRHQQSLSEARGLLDGGLAALARSPELAAEDLRLAARALGRVTGHVDVEDVLDRVFSTFCIGK